MKKHRGRGRRQRKGKERKREETRRSEDIQQEDISQMEERVAEKSSESIIDSQAGGEATQTILTVNQDTRKEI